MSLSLPTPTDDARVDTTLGRHARRSRAGLAAFLLVAANMRIAVVALSPLLSDIEHSEHLSSGTAGLLTTAPLACFGIFAFSAPFLIPRLGPQWLLALAMLVLTGGVTLWLLSGVAMLFAGTVLAGAGIGIANIVMPALIKRDFAAQGRLVTALYTAVLCLSGAIAAGLTVPLQNATRLGWRHTLTLWAIPAAIALLVTVVRARGSDAPSAGSGSPSGAPLRSDALDERPATLEKPADARPPMRSLFTDRVAWAVTIFMGAQSLGFYTITAWLPTLLQDHHMTADRAGWMLSFSSFPAIVGALLTPALDRRLRGGPAMVVIATILYVVGYVALLVDPVGLIYLSVTALGLAQGALISLAIHYIVARSPDHHHTGQLSAMAQGCGYLLASIGPTALGALHSASGGWTMPLLTLTALLSVQMLAGIQASRDRHVLTGRSATDF